MRWCASSRPTDTPIDPAKPPFIVVDPRAGHGPGIGGMKQDSEIGVALAAGPSLLLHRLPARSPMPGQTIEDVCAAEAAFVAEVAARHPEAEGKPVIVGNCQAGWQIMMMAAIRPDLVGPILLAGSPLSYWAGVHGHNPMRYLGGTLGGTWLTALAGDLGNGIFDGAHLVANFESLNPANTYWDKVYNVYSKVDTEAAALPRVRDLVGQPGAAQCRRDAVDRRQSVRRQQAHVGRDPHLRRHARRPAQHHVADHRALLVGRQHHAAAAGAGLDHRSLRPRGRDRRQRPDHRLHAAPDASAISASSSPARWRPRSMPNSPPAWT